MILDRELEELELDGIEVVEVVSGLVEEELEVVEIEVEESVSGLVELKLEGRASVE